MNLLDAEVIALCAAAGIKWLEPDKLPDGTIDSDGFPGSFDMATMVEMRTLITTLRAVSGGREKRWPFLESPGEFTARLHKAMQEFPLIGAVRHVLIENPPVLTTPAAPALPDGGLHAAVRFAALGIAELTLDQSYFGPHMIGEGDKVCIFKLAAAPQREQG